MRGNEVLIANMIRLLITCFDLSIIDGLQDLKGESRKRQLVDLCQPPRSQERGQSSQSRDFFISRRARRSCCDLTDAMKLAL